jgi:pimeloyl-ACP methyl ester carboxylesterase
MTLLFVLLGFLCALPLVGLMYQVAGSRKDARRYPPPGKLTDVGGHRLHVHFSGAGSQVAVLEAGIAGSTISWELVRREAESFVTVVSYDRAGLGWSDAADEPRTIENTVVDLKRLLDAEGIARPILVGHSFGGLAVLEYACKHREELAGLVLVDPLPASEWCPVAPEEAARLRRGIALARRGAWLARFGVVRASLDLLQAGSRRVPRLAARVSGQNAGAKLMDRLAGEVKKLPRELWPLVQTHWSQSKSFRSMVSHLESLPGSASACSVDVSLGDLPIVVLSAADSTPSRLEEHRRMAARSTRGEMLVVENSGHWIQLDRPDLVVDAIRKVAAISSSGRTLPPPPPHPSAYP